LPFPPRSLAWDQLCRGQIGDHAHSRHELVLEHLVRVDAALVGASAPGPVGLKIMPTIQVWFGPNVVKLRLTGSGAGQASLSRRVAVGSL
jgi:hypothetical protein